MCRTTSFHPNLACKLLYGVATSRVRNTNRHEHGRNRGLSHLVMERVLGLDDVAIIHFQPVVVDHGRGRRQSDLAHDGMANRSAASVFVERLMPPNDDGPQLS